VPRPDDAMGMLSRRVVPLLAVSGIALMLVPVLRLHGGGHTAKAAGTLPPLAVQQAAQTAALPPARGAGARTVAPAVTLPVDSPWALPPMLVLQSRTGGRASAALRRRVLGLTHLALSPAARRSVRQGDVSAGALWLLA